MYTAVFAHHYHIRPWEMGKLTAIEFDNLVESYERYMAEAKKAGKG